MAAKDNSPSIPTADVLVVGAGVAGLYAIYKLRQLGFSVRAIEAGSGVGGTWFWNRYPGCRCDVESLEYSYSFSEELQQEWHWDERYGTQAQILQYLNQVADRFDLRTDITFSTRIATANFDRDASQWTLTTTEGESLTASHCIMAVGNLSTPRTPDFAGLESFSGNWYHTGMWPHDGVDFSGQRVAVIGTGSSGVQSIPHIAQQASHLTVFQRTANFILPARNAPIPDEEERSHKANYAERRVAAYETPFGISGYPPPANKALEVTTEQRDADYEFKWQRGGQISFLYAYQDLLTNPQANQTAADFVRNKIRGIVKNPQVAELLCPDDHPIGTKRLILDTGYFETFNRDNVSLVDVRSAPIKAFTTSGLKTQDAEYEFDAVVFATGFDAMTGALREIDITASGGVDLRQKWQDGPRTYLGLMVAGLPNLFMVTGPQSPGVKSNMMLSIEHHINFIADSLVHLREHGLAQIQAEQSAEDAWVEHNNEVANATLYPHANSWYMGANIPGKPRIFMPYVGGVQNYAKKVAELVANDYEGFEMR